MGKLTRQQFLLGVEDVWADARTQFARDQVLHGRLVALDASGRQKYFLQGDPDDAALIKRGVIGIPGDWKDHLPLLAAEFGAHRAVAAILMGEAWMGADETAAETLRMGLAVHEHPMRDEIIFTAASWPREYATRSYYAVIERDDRGQHPTLGPTRDFHSGPERGVTFLMSWLPELLPRPYR